MHGSRPALRHQLAASSPIPLAALARATAAALGVGDDPRDAVRTLLRERYAASGALLCGSGTQALDLAIRSCRERIGADAIVALPAYSCYDVATAALGAGGRIALYDIDPLSLAPDEDSLERVMQAGARVVVIAPLCGLPVDWARLESRAARHDAVLIEDAAQGHGASWHGASLGSLGRISTLSFGRGKGWTGGSGGAVLTRGVAHAIVLPRARLTGELRVLAGLGAQKALGRPWLYGLPRAIPQLALGDTVFKEPGALTGMSRAAAGALLASRRAADREADSRRATARVLFESFAGMRDLQTLTPLPGAIAGYLRLPVRASGDVRSAARSAAGERLGIAPGYPTTLGELPSLRTCLTGPERQWPGAECLVRELMTIPTHSFVGASDRAAIGALLSRAGSARAR